MTYTDFWIAFFAFYIGFYLGKWVFQPKPFRPVIVSVDTIWGIKKKLSIHAVHGEDGEIKTVTLNQN